MIIDEQKMNGVALIASKSGRCHFHSHQFPTLDLVLPSGSPPKTSGTAHRDQASTSMLGPSP
jgi:hypothetical protein